MSLVGTRSASPIRFTASNVVSPTFWISQ